MPKRRKLLNFLKSNMQRFRLRMVGITQISEKLLNDDSYLWNNYKVDI